MKKLSAGYWIVLSLVSGGIIASLWAESSYRNTIMGTGARRNTVEFNWVEPSAGSAMNMVPGTTNTNALGTSALRWSDVQTTNLTAAGNVTINGNTTVGDAAADTLTVNAATWTVSSKGVVISTGDGTGRDTLIVPGSSWWEAATSTPSVPNTSYAGVAAITSGSTSELKALDGAGNVTLLSPHNEKGEWVFSCVNTKTGKTVYVNMERFIHRMEEITGEHFMDVTEGKRHRK